MGIPSDADDGPDRAGATDGRTVAGPLPSRAVDGPGTHDTVSTMLDELTRRWTTVLRLLIPALILAFLVYQAAVRFPAAPVESGTSSPLPDAVAAA
ncbi:MAG: hypothetical protein ACFCVK_22490 [Acidimicrobiales bacterium]